MNTLKSFALILLALVLTSNVFAVTYRRSNIRNRAAAPLMQAADQKAKASPEIAAFGCPTPQFGPQITTTLDSGADAIHVADFNRDGIPDVVVNRDPGLNERISILLGNGDGTLGSPSTIYTGYFQAKHIISGDFNNDGKLDLIVDSFNENWIKSFLGDGNGGFSGGVTEFSVVAPTGMKTGDFNRDGKLDVVVVSGGLGGGITVMQGNGNGTFTNLGSGDIPNAGLYGDIDVGDFDRDGNLDVAANNRGGGTKVTVLWGNGTGGFSGGNGYPISTDTDGLVVADVNRDGYPDIVSTGFGSTGGTEILINNRNGANDGTFTISSTLGFGGGFIVKGEFNSDGRADFAFSRNFDFKVGLGIEPNTIDTPVVFSNSGFNSREQDMAVADFNGDGKDDFLAFDGTNIAIRINTCSNAPCGEGVNFGAETTIGSLEGGTGAPLSAITGDFFVDGTMDIAVIDPVANKASVFYGNGNGFFTGVRSFNVNPGANNIAAADFNGDGRQDIVADASGNDLSLLTFNSAGFATLSNIPLGFPSAGVVTGDFNKDGKADIATINAAIGVLYVLPGNGSGGFSAPLISFGGSAFGPMASGDLNRDGNPDIIFADQVDVGFKVSLGLGNGLFAPPIGGPTASLPRDLKLADLNNDGKEDLVVPLTDADQVAVFLGNGGGGFSVAPGSPVTFDSARGAAIADYDNDGIADLAVTSRDTDKVGVFRGLGSGSFASPLLYNVGDSPRSIVPIELDKNHRVDWVAANFNAGTLSIRLNTCNSAPEVTPSTGVVQQQGAPERNVQIGTAFDGDQPLNALTTLIFDAGSGIGDGHSATANGITIDNLTIDDQGVIKADLVATCTAGGANFRLKVIDARNTLRDVPLAIGVTTAEIALDYGPLTRTVPIGGNIHVMPEVGPSSSGSLPPIEFDSVSPAGFTGNINVDDSGQVSITNAGPVGEYTVTVRSSNACGIKTSSFKVIVGGSTCSNTQFGSPASFPMGPVAPTVPLLGDLNNDGKLDLVSTNGASNSITRLLGDGLGGFGSAITFPTGGTNPESFVLADLNRDGKLDAVAGNRNSGDIGVLLGDGTGVFATAVVYETSGVGGVDVGDFNLDGFPDILASTFHQNGATASVMLNDQTGRFGTPANFLVGSNPHGVTAADFNLDGLTDIAVANLFSFNVSVLINNGTGGFARTNLPVNGPFIIRSGDFNNDGRPDIVTGNYGDGINSNGSISILLGDGSGGFSAAVNVPASEVDTVSLADYNSDGKMDVIADNGFNLAVYLGDGAGNLSNAFETTSESYRGVAAGDLNGDGRIDAVGVRGNGEAGVHLSSCTGGPVFISPNNVGFRSGQANSFTVKTSAFPVAAINRSGTLPGGVTFVNNGDGTGTLSGNPPAAAGGLYPLTFSTNNGSGAASQNFTLTVASPLGITSPNSVTFQALTAGSFNVTTSGVPAATLSVTSGVLPQGLFLTSNGNGTGTISGTPAFGTGGIHNFTITAANGVSESASQTFTLTVNETPAITSYHAAGFQVGVSGNFQVTRIGFPNPITLSVSGSLPNNITFNPANGQFSGTPAAGTLGSYPLTITARSVPTNQIGTQDFTLVVCQSTAVEITNLNDSGAGSLRQAIQDACPGSTLNLGAGLAGQMNVGSLINIDKNLNITGPGADLLTIRGTGSTRLFNIEAGNTVSISGITLTNGNTSSFGGAIINSGDLTLTDSVISNSTAVTDGGAIFNAGALRIVGSTLTGNSVQQFGGAVSSPAGSLTMINSTISGNHSSNSGGGLYIGGTVDIINCTITNNRADWDASGSGLGGGVYNNNPLGSTIVTVRNSIVAGNFLRQNVASPVANEFDGTPPGSSLFNLIGTGGGGINSVLNPTLALNGGKTPTHALVLSGPAVDKGSAVDLSLVPLGTDQRGQQRPVDNPLVANAPGGDGSDIGAFEIQAPTAASVSISGRVTIAGGGRAMSNAIVRITDQSGAVHSALTNAFGYFSVEGVSVGQSVVINVTAKGYRFVPLSIAVTDDIAGLDLQVSP